MTSLYELIVESIAALVASYKEKSQDGLTISEMVQLIGDLVGVCMTLADQLYDDATGEFKKAQVVDAVSQAWDNYVSGLNVKSIPDWIEPLVKRAAKDTLMLVVDGMIEIVYKWRGPDFPDGVVAPQVEVASDEEE